jgi:hypothetical protein
MLREIERHQFQATAQSDFELDSDVASEIMYVDDDEIFDFDDCCCLIVDRYLYRELSCEECHCEHCDNCYVCYDKENKCTQV